MGTQEPIAIIGSGCRFPGSANSPCTLWNLLRNPRDLLFPIPEKRFNTGGFYHKDGQYHGHTNVTQAYPLSEKGIQQHFDAQFFGISAAEADVTGTTATRNGFRSARECREDDRHSRGLQYGCVLRLDGRDYEHLMNCDEMFAGKYHVTGTAWSLMSNRISYFFDWHGPSITIDTACSSSLYAVHYAVQQLRSGDSRVAIATGSNLLLDPSGFVGGAKLQMLSPDGRSRMWDVAANGYARGEGVAAVVLKKLSAAEADGDPIMCVIRETAINQDGRTRGNTV